MQPTVLVTGANGFVGRKMFDSLRRRGVSAIGVDLVSDIKAEIWKGDYEFLELTNVVDRSLAVIHIAARNNISASYENEELYLEENFGKFTRFLLRNSKKINKVIYLSSCSIYSPGAHEPIGTNFGIDPVSPYSKSKYLLEKYIVEFCREEQISCACFRTFNVVGVTQISSTNFATLDRIFPSIIRSITENQEFKVFGSNYPTLDGSCIRDYIHVEDLVHLITMSLDTSYQDADVYNAGTGTGVSVLDVLNQVENRVGKKIPFTLSDRRRGDVAYRVADISKTTERFGWKPLISWENIIREMCTVIRI